MADALEQTKNLFSVDDYNEDDISDKSKVISALENPFGEFRPKEEIIEKAKATGTGLLTGTLGIPSDAATLASAVSSGMAKYADSPTAMMLKDVLKKAEKDVGRPAFDKWFTDTTGLESNPENVDQLVGEVLSPTGAFLAPVKTLKNIFAPLKKGVTDFFDKMPPPDSGLAVETAGVGQLDQTKNLLDKENISKPIETNIPALPSAGELANKPTINPTIIGTQTEAGKKAEDIYDDLVAKGVTDPKEIFKKTGGGYVGRDGKFRFDLDDRDAKLKVNPDELEFDVDYQNMSSSKDMLETKTVTLGNILDFDSLYKQYYKNINVSGKNYQALRNVKVVFNYGEPPKRTLGSYSPSEDRILLHMKNLSSPFRKGQEQEDYIMSTLIHEVQHAVQRREGFSSGANSEDMSDIVLDAINEDGVYKLPLGSDKKEITTPYISGISRYNTDNAYHVYSEADILSRAIKNNTNTDKFIHLADNISDNVPDFTGDRKIEFLRNYEILLDSKNRLNSYIKKGVSAKNKEDLVSLTMDILPSDFNKAKSAFGFKDKDTFANFVFEDLTSLDDLKGFVDRAYNRARVNINLDDKSLAKLEAEQARRLKNDEALLNFKGEVDREATRLYLDEYGEMEARLVEQRYARRQELRRDPMLLTDEQITEKMLEDTGDIFKEPDKYGRTAKILGGFKKGQTSIPTNNINTVYESANILETTPIKNSPALQKISEITKLQDGPLGSRTPMDKDGLPKNLIRDKDGKPLILYYGDRGYEYKRGVNPKEVTTTPTDTPAKLKNKFRGANFLTYGSGSPTNATYTTPNPVFASSYALGSDRGSVIPIYVIGNKVTDIGNKNFMAIDRAGAKADRGEVIIGNAGQDYNFNKEVNQEIANAADKKYGTQQYVFKDGVQVFSAITGERLTDLPSIKQNIRSKLLNLSQKEEDILLKKMSPEERIKYKAEKTYIPEDEGSYFIEDEFKRDRQIRRELNEQKRNLAKGGDMNKQMEMFEDGGLKQEGGTIDPVSGNDVPPGSTQEEVRDDIPAQLSEGEFVFPADVVRYIGLEKLMRLRQEAKQGLKMMEEMGQMGNSEEATMPDDLPFDETDLDMEDEEEYNNDTQEMNQGGVIQAQTGTFVAPGVGVTTMPSQFAGQQLPSAGTTPSYTVPNIPPPTPAPVGGFTPIMSGQVGQQPTNVTPTFQSLIGRTPGQYDEFREYTNEAGMKLQIPFKDGQPIYPIPEGYTYVDPEEIKTEEVTTKQVTPRTTRVTKQDGGDDPDSGGKTSAVDLTGAPLSYKSVFNMDKLDTALKDIAFGQLSTFDIKGGLSRGIKGQVDLNSITLGFQKDVMANFKNQFQLTDKYGPNFNLAVMTEMERNSLANSLNDASKLATTVLTDVDQNPLDINGLVSKANKAYGMNVTKNSLYSKGTNILSKSKISNLAREMMRQEKIQQEKTKENVRQFERFSDPSYDTEAEKGLSDAVSAADRAQASVEAGFNVEETFGRGEPDSGPTGGAPSQGPSDMGLGSISTDNDGGGNDGTDGGFGGPSGGDYGGTYKGSLITRKKPSKPKKMKRGGLASKK